MWAKIHWEEPISVTVFATKSEAAKTGNDGTIVGSSTDIDQNVNLLTTDILNVYNKITGLSVARFSDRPSGAKRLWTAITELPEAKEMYTKVAKAPEDANSNNAAGETKEDDGNAVNDQEKSDMSATAKKAAKGGAKKATKSSARKQVAKKADSAARAPRAGSFRVKHIFPKAKENPYQANSKSHATYELVMKKPGKTFHEYVALGGRGNTLVNMVQRGFATTKD